MSRDSQAERRHIVFHDQSYPARYSTETIDALIPQPFHQVDASGLAQALDDGATMLTSLHGAYFPKDSWTAILRFCQRGGNLALLGGAPFTRPIRGDGTIESETSAYMTTLGLGPFVVIDDVAATCTFEPAALATFLDKQDLVSSQDDIGQFWAANPQLTQSSDHPDELGSAGPIDVVLLPLIYAIDQQSRRVATPFYCMEHHSGTFAGGRWLISAWQPASEVTWCDNAAAIAQMITLASEGVQRLDVSPTMACYQPDELPTIIVDYAVQSPLTCEVAITPPWQSTPFITHEYRLSAVEGSERLPLPLCDTPGLYRITITYHTESGPKLCQQQGFWVWDETLVAQTRGKRLTAGRDLLYQGGHPFPLYGTTYMDSAIQRKFLLMPNPARWEVDFAEMHQAGINLIRTGVWTDWDTILPTIGENEVALRSLDALVMTACLQDIQLIFTFFSFAPPIISGSNPWLDPESLHHQEAFVAQLARRYRDVETVLWDLINEPSFGDPKRIFQQRALPHRDPIERAAFRTWLQAHYSLDELQMRWRMTPDDLPDWEHVMPPDEADFSTDIADNTTTRHRLRAHDFTHFSQDMLTQWGARLTRVIREAGNDGLVGIGQDEAGVRPAPQFYGEALDYTTTHPWWNNNDLLWDMVLDKLPDRPNIHQEVGVMLTRDIAGQPFRTDIQSAHLLERKLLLSLVTRSAGVIQWLWHTNAYMTNHNENNIGLVRADGSVKPEMQVMREFGRLIHTIAPHLREQVAPQIWLVIPYAQWFTHPQLGIEATRRAVRALGYGCGIIPQAVNEYRFGYYLDQTQRPAAVIVPGVQYLSRQVWPHLERYVHEGGRLLMSGVISRDEHALEYLPDWLPSPGVTLTTQPVSHDEFLHWRGEPLHLTYDGDKISYVRKSHDQLHVTHAGNGVIFWAGLPIELANSDQAIVDLYHEVLTPPSIAQPVIGLLQHHITLANGVTLQVFISETSVPRTVTISPGTVLVVSPNRAGAVLIAADGLITTFGGCSIVK